MVEIVTTRLLIRRATKEDTKKIEKLNNTGGSAAYLHGLSDEDREVIFRDTKAVQELMARMATALGNGEAQSYGAWLGSEIIGYITLNNCHSEMPDLQIALAPAYQGQGYGYEFLSALIKDLFRIGYCQFRYMVMPYNAASIALVEKVGGILQAPTSEAEHLLFKTYHIVKP